MSSATQIAGAFVTGVDLNRDGIPDVLQQQQQYQGVRMTSSYGTGHMNSVRFGAASAGDIVVTAPQKNYLTVVNMVPKIEQQFSQQDVCVTTTETIERCNIAHEWTKEEYETEVPQVTVRETITPKIVESVVVDRRVVEERVCLAGQREVFETSVDVRQKVHISTAQAPLQTWEEVIEVPEVVNVPVMNVVERQETREVISTDVTMVPHVERYEKIVEVPREEVVQRVVDIPEVHLTKTIQHVLKFFAEGEAPGQATLQAETTLLQCRARAQELRTYAMQLGRETVSLQKDMRERFWELSDLEVRLQKVRASKTTQQVVTTQVSSVPMASAYVTGVDLNRDGIPDVLQ